MQIIMTYATTAPGKRPGSRPLTGS